MTPALNFDSSFNSCGPIHAITSWVFHPCPCRSSFASSSVPKERMTKKSLALGIARYPCEILTNHCEWYHIIRDAVIARYYLWSRKLSSIPSNSILTHKGMYICIWCSEKNKHDRDFKDSKCLIFNSVTAQCHQHFTEILCFSVRTNWRLKQ